ncbi:MAG: septal ring lytic transglycosylase RlpA family protein [Methyloligellaceae bacterium]
MYRVFLEKSSVFSAFKSLIAVVLAGLLVAGCSWSNFGFKSSSTRLSPKVVEYGQPVPKGGGVYKVGKPYKIGSQWYRPREEPDYDEVGVASWYGHLFHGRYTANREIYDMDALTAAHPTLPLPSYVRVTNRSNGRSLVLRVNDRGPYANDRIIDLSRKAARLLGMEKSGTAPVRVTYLRRAPLNGNDSYEHRYLAQQSWANPGRRYSSRRRPNRRYASRQSYRYDRITTGGVERKRRARKKTRHRKRKRGYVVQAGVFQSRWNANRARGRMSRYGRTFIESHKTRHYPIYRVMMGPYRNRNQAKRAAGRIARAGIYDAIVMRN